MKNRISLAAVLCIALLVSNGATAGLLSIDLNDSSLAGSLPLGASHDVLVTKGAIGWYDANLSATHNVTLTYEFLGFEAGWTNAFLVDDVQAFVNQTAAVGATASSSAAANALLNFAFTVLIGGNAGHSVTNGANNYPIDTYYPETGLGELNFFLGYADAAHNSVYIALDDGGGAPWTNTSIDDDNHDDLVVKVTAVAVPEPAPLVLLGIGLAGLGFISRKKLI